MKIGKERQGISACKDMFPMIKVEFIYHRDTEVTDGFAF